MGAIETHSWIPGLLLVVLLFAMLPWTIEAWRTRIADHAFVIDADLYIDAGSQQLILTKNDVRQTGILGPRSLDPLGMIRGPFVGVDFIHPDTGRQRRYVVPLEDAILLRRLSAAGFEVSARPID